MRIHVEANVQRTALIQVTQMVQAKVARADRAAIMVVMAIVLAYVRPRVQIRVRTRVREGVLVAALVTA